MLETLSVSNSVFYVAVAVNVFFALLGYKHFPRRSRALILAWGMAAALRFGDMILASNIFASVAFLLTAWDLVNMVRRELRGHEVP